MYYYEVAPADRRYNAQNLLTYSSKFPLKLGQIVVVKVRTISMRGFIVNHVPKPTFKTNTIQNLEEKIIIPASHIAIFNWMQTYYPASVGVIASLFTPPSGKLNIQSETKSDVDATTKIISSLTPTTNQSMVIENIIASTKRTQIIHGDTGTGKTYVYIELAKKIIAQNKSVIILTPEISLTPQLVEQFMYHFSNVRLVHSGLSLKQRRETWQDIYYTKQPQIIIGTRSALFSPVKNLGLIIIDEFHDSAYKQDQSPRYNALRVAARIAGHESIKLILGSATPPVDEYFYAVHTGAELHRLTEKPLAKKSSSNIRIVDLSNKTELSKYPLLSNSLLNSLQEKLNNKEQSLLFLNKRGTSRRIICQNCGWYAQCIRCNSSYTYHHDSHLLICHICARTAPVPTICPTCHSHEIHFKNPGTKAIENYLHTIFPNAKIGRYDKDNKKNDTFSANQADIAAGKIDILVGTQLLSKGHDLPRLRLVGILLAESSLEFPDYNSEEKTFQLLHQIAGRVGRNDEKSDLIVQTYNPKSRIINYVQHNEDDWIHFYSEELEQRRNYHFPPYVYLLKISVFRKTEQSAEKFIQKIHTSIIEKKYSGIDILGPSPAYFYMQNGGYNWQIIVRSSVRKRLVNIIKDLPNSCTYNIDPTTLL